MVEAMSAKDIERADFAVALRGYDRDEVDSYLRSLAEEHRRLNDELSSARRGSAKPYHGLGADMGDLLQHAKDAADQLTRAAEEEAARTRAEAEAAATATRDEADTAAATIREQAEADAAGTREQAEREADRRVEEASERVLRLKETETEARARLAAVRAEITAVAQRFERVEASLEGADEPSPTAEEGQAEQTAAGAETSAA